MAYILVKSFQYANANSPGFYQRCESPAGREFLFHKAFRITRRHDNPAAHIADNESLTEFFETYGDASLVARLDEMPEISVVPDPDCDFEWALENDPRLAQA